MSAYRTHFRSLHANAYVSAVAALPDSYGASFKDLVGLNVVQKGSKRFFLQRFNPKVTLDGSLGDEVQYSYEDIEGFAKELGAFVDSVKIR